MKRHLLSVFAVAAFASFAGAQQPTDSTHARAHGDSAMHHGEHAMGTSATTSHDKTKTDSAHAAKHTSSSGGEVDLRRGGAGYSVRATSRDFVGADDTRGDDLWRREQMMDARCGKSRDRCGKP
jgi:hypothetical protein